MIRRRPPGGHAAFRQAPAALREYFVTAGLPRASEQEENIDDRRFMMKESAYS